MVTAIINRILFHFAPRKLIKRYTSKAAKRMFFIREYELAYRKLWLGEFQKTQKSQIREEIRREYDKVNESNEATKTRLEEEKKKPQANYEIIKNLEAMAEGYKKDIGQFKEQIDSLDAEIKGYGEALESLRSVLPLIEKHILEA